MEECTFQENIAKSGNGGALIGTDSINVKILEGQFVKNKAGQGGAIRFSRIDFSQIQKSQFMENNADDEGGAIFFTNVFSSQMNETKFERNKAKRAGAVALNQNVSTDLRDCEFTLNAAEKGGAIVCDRSVQANIVNTVISRNEANLDAGGLGVEWGDNVYITMENISCVGNRAHRFGGCIGSRNGAKVRINGSKFTKNAAGILGDGLAGEDSSFEVR